MFEDTILLVCTHAAVFWMGYKWGIHNAVIRIITNYLANPEDMQQAFNRLNDLKDEEADAEIAVEARVEGQQVYLWRKDTQTFLAQGKTIDEAILAISQNHQGTYKIDKETVDRIRAELPNRL